MWASGAASSLGSGISKGAGQTGPASGTEALEASDRVGRRRTEIPQRHALSQNDALAFADSPVS